MKNVRKKNPERSLNSTQFDQPPGAGGDDRCSWFCALWPSVPCPPPSFGPGTGHRVAGRSRTGHSPGTWPTQGLASPHQSAKFRSWLARRMALGRAAYKKIEKPYGILLHFLGLKISNFCVKKSIL